MKIDPEICIGCEACIPYCPVEAISLQADAAVIDFDECVECSNCLRAAVCPADASDRQELAWPHTIRSILSDPLTVAEASDISGRGTEEMKTNDVTGRFRRGWVGIGIELGRPTLGTCFRDVEKVAKGVSALGVVFESANPTTELMSEPSTGAFRTDVLDEKVLSAILEFPLKADCIPPLIDVLKIVSEQIDTVFSLDISTRCESDGSVPITSIIKKTATWFSINGKTNLGLGRPPAKDA